MATKPTTTETDASILILGADLTCQVAGVPDCRDCGRNPVNDMHADDCQAEVPTVPGQAMKPARLDEIYRLVDVASPPLLREALAEVDRLRAAGAELCASAIRVSAGALMNGGALVDAVAAEREACAKAADESCLAPDAPCCCSAVASAIRARGR